MEDQTRSLKDPWELDGVSTFDSEALLAAIMIKGGQMEPLFTDPRFFYNMNNMWWRKWIPTFKYWWTVSEKKYEPLWDREGFEEIEDHTEESGTLDSSTTGREVMDTDTTGREVIDTDTTGREVTDEDTTSSLTGKEIVDDATTSGSNTTSTASTENKVSAYDASTYQPSSSSSSSSGVTESASSTDDKITDTTEHTTGVLDKTVNTTGTADTTRNTTGTADTTRNTTGAVDTDTTGSKDSAHSLHTWGNWGISTTSQKLMYSEYEVRFKLNPYELMSDIFLNEMSVRVF